jgi:hypothetical protein
MILEKPPIGPAKRARHHDMRQVAHSPEQASIKRNNPKHPLAQPVVYGGSLETNANGYRRRCQDGSCAAPRLLMTAVRIRDFYGPGQKNNAIRSKCAPICLKFGFRDDLETPNKRTAPNHYSCGWELTSKTNQHRSNLQDCVHAVHQQTRKVYKIPSKVPQVGPYTRSLCLGKNLHTIMRLWPTHTHTPSSLVQVTMASCTPISKALTATTNVILHRW